MLPTSGAAPDARNLRLEGRQLIMGTNPQAGIDGRRMVGTFTRERIEQAERGKDGP
jgi:hypothetical protein